ncbi:zinc knuckle domain-containing protein, putative [Eimeria necatrix]|uniref:Zinc knuckle domain-containing protein, putative n=1 Tax=Eimeria necatrix TaxID=51315 RepID=U6MME3_9EIME|nr:zinc knuckle domain-containing protein, putative [Eimeria necatrix]CDJ64243.1 zinc knuckle domain-containing protein, putative [Eimeria necatrix]
MSMEQLMALVPLEAALSHKEKGRKSRWERKKAPEGSRWGSETVTHFSNFFCHLMEFRRPFKPFRRPFKAI